MTDSTVDLPLALVEAAGLRVVPMTVTFEDESFISGVTIDAPAFYERLRGSSTLPTTSQPVPAWFEEAYADAADDGADGVVSIHVSGKLSGTCDVARLAARDAPLPVEVVDSGQVSAALALSVLAAQRAATRGETLERVAGVARDVAATARVFFVVDTLEYLRRGGRLTGTQALVGSMLRVKPILTIDDGEVGVVDRARTWTRARDRLAELVEQAAAGRPVDVVISHAFAADRAEEVRALVTANVEARTVLESHIGPVVGTHCGPGTVGVGVAPEAS